MPLIPLFEPVETEDMPSGWDMLPNELGVAIDPVWGTDFQRSDDAAMGPYSVEFLPEVHTGALQALIGEFIPVEDGADYLAWARVKADSVSAGRNVYLVTYWYDETRVLVGSTILDWVRHHFDPPRALPAANTWYTIGGTVTPYAGARWARIVVAKDATNAFSLFFDEADLQRAPPQFRASMSSTQAISTGGVVTVVWDHSEKADGFSINTSTGVLTCVRPGRWHIAAGAELDDVAGGTTMNISLTRTPYGGAEDTVLRGSRCINSSGTRDVRAVLSGDLDLNFGDTLKVKVGHDHGSNRNLVVSGLAENYVLGTLIHNH